MTCDAIDETPVVAAPPAELRIGDKSFPLPRGQRTFLIGSRDHCDLRLQEEAVSPGRFAG